MDLFSICGIDLFQMLASASHPFVGGRNFDHILVDHFSRYFATKYKINLQTNSRARLRLLEKVDKLKKQMSANSAKLPFNVECFVDDKDLNGEMDR